MFPVLKITRGGSRFPYAYYIAVSKYQLYRTHKIICFNSLVVQLHDTVRGELIIWQKGRPTGPALYSVLIFFDALLKKDERGRKGVHPRARTLLGSNISRRIVEGG